MALSHRCWRDTGCAPTRDARGVRTTDHTGTPIPVSPRARCGERMSRVFLSHSSRDTQRAIALKRWLVEQEPALAGEIFLDLDRDTGIRPSERWKEALQRANVRCEAVICLLSAHWEASHECKTEYRYAEVRMPRVSGTVTSCRGSF